MKGRIHSVETLGTLDGPGVRTVIFMQGCNMRCLYCHNRDSWDPAAGKEITIEEIISQISSYRSYYGKKGGVTFSGGEPLLQSSFLLETVGRLKALGIHTALDTSGSVYNRRTNELFDIADLVILDIKHSDSFRFRDLCGFSDENLRKNLKYLQKGVTPYWIRQVIVGGYTDSEKQIDGLAHLLNAGCRPERTELLPYHGMGLEKWEQEGDLCSLKNSSPPTEKRVNQLKTRLLNSSIVSRK